MTALKKIVQDWATRTISEGDEMLKDVYDASKPGKLTSFGKAQLACGTGVFDSAWIILVEGRADVVNLLRAGYDNAIAIEGARIDESVTKLTEGKRVVAFLDGDRAGDLILKELHGVVKIDKVLRAPQGKEVEECTPLEISEILKDAFSPEVTICSAASIFSPPGPSSSTASTITRGGIIGEKGIHKMIIALNMRDSKNHYSQRNHPKRRWLRTRQRYSLQSATFTLR